MSAAVAARAAERVQAPSNSRLSEPDLGARSLIAVRRSCCRSSIDRLIGDFIELTDRRSDARLRA